MQEPAKAPELRTCHERAMKHESIVYQFQSICINVVRNATCTFFEKGSGRTRTEILHELPPPMPPMLIFAVLVAVAAVAVAVDAMDMTMELAVEDMPDMSMMAGSKVEGTVEGEKTKVR